MIDHLDNLFANLSIEALGEATVDILAKEIAERLQTTTC